MEYQIGAIPHFGFNSAGKDFLGITAFIWRPTNRKVEHTSKESKSE
jgi:hypothetical protein